VHVIIAGCGRVGAQLAATLTADGHDVAIVDKDRGAFRRLGDDFKGQTVRGLVFDRTALETAKIHEADAFIAVTSGDNSNIVSARTAKERYAVPRVVARIYDPIRAEIFSRLGVTIVASARWTADRILTELAPQQERVESVFGSGVGDVMLVTAEVPHGVHGIPVARISRPGHWVPAALTRNGTTSVPSAGSLLETGDVLHFSADRSALDDLRQAVSSLSAEEHL
jgi:trk system potassium uptake protein TrkA